MPEYKIDPYLEELLKQNGYYGNPSESEEELAQAVPEEEEELIEEEPAMEESMNSNPAIRLHMISKNDHYLKQMKLGQAGARIRGYKNTYTDINVTSAGNGAYKVSSLRQPTGETYKLKTYMIVKKQPDGKWLITEEMMQTKVQTFLKYAK